jgi:hypothetical protein
MDQFMIQTTEWLKAADGYVLTVLQIARRAFAETTRIDPMAIIMSPGMISIGTLLAIGYGCYLARR